MAIVLPAVIITEIESDGNKDSHPIPRKKLISSAANSVTVKNAKKVKNVSF